jgi:hypothetical protein
MTNKPRRASDLPTGAVEALWQGNVIQAIKAVRRERNIGLKEAKDAVDAYIASQPALKKKMDEVLATAQQRFIRWLVGFLVLAAGLSYLIMA